MEMSIPFAYSSTIGALSSKFSSASVTSASDERRKEGNGNGNGTKLLDPSSQPHPPLHYSPKQPPPQQQQQQQQHNPDPTPDQHPIVPVSTGSNIKTPTGPTGKALVSIRYRECLKNHAANVGGHVVDGCGEFMPSGGEALKCAACDCHRNFHRKVIDGISPTQLLLPNKSIILSPPPVHQKHPMGLTLPTSPPSGPMMGSGATESSSEDHDILPTPPPFLQAKKRFRTKFSREQKEKMMEFAEKIGWRIQRHEEHVLERFCDEVGVKRNVLKVWMHNNKQALKRKHFQDENEIAIPRPVDHQEVDYKTSEVV